MDQALLVGPDIEVGRDAVAVLDASGLKPVVALMAMFPEYSDWRFVIASPALDQEKPLKAHIQVAKALRGEFVSRLPITMVLPTKDPFIRDLRKVFRFKIKVGQQTLGRLGGQTIGGRFLNDAFVLRVA
jgi:hypothetical protein